MIYLKAQKLFVYSHLWKCLCRYEPFNLEKSYQNRSNPCPLQTNHKLRTRPLPPVFKNILGRTKSLNNWMNGPYQGRCHQWYWISKRVHISLFLKAKNDGGWLALAVVIWDKFGHLVIIVFPWMCKSLNITLEKLFVLICSNTRLAPP